MMGVLLGACHLQAKRDIEEKLQSYDPNNDPMIEVCQQSRSASP
jgi:hypothetical protein